MWGRSYWPLAYGGAYWGGAVVVVEPPEAPSAPGGRRVVLLPPRERLRLRGELVVTARLSGTLRTRIRVRGALPVVAVALDGALATAIPLAGAVARELTLTREGALTADVHGWLRAHLDAQRIKVQREMVIEMEDETLLL